MQDSVDGLKSIKVDIMQTCYFYYKDMMRALCISMRLETELQYIYCYTGSLRATKAVEVTRVTLDLFLVQYTCRL